MEKALRIIKVESRVISLMEKFPILSYYTASRGWSFLISWGHRLAGLTLVGYMFAHIFTLSLLFLPATFDAEMRLLHNFVFSFLEWALAIPLIFHSLNGGRLILYELFHMREDEIVIRCMVILGLIYISILGFFFIGEGQPVPVALFWSITFAMSLVAFFIVVNKILYLRENWIICQQMPQEIKRDLSSDVLITMHVAGKTDLGFVFFNLWIIGNAHCPYCSTQNTVPDRVEATYVRIVSYKGIEHRVYLIIGVIKASLEYVILVGLIIFDENVDEVTGIPKHCDLVGGDLFAE